jgi:hypothetical protein
MPTLLLDFLSVGKLIGIIADVLSLIKAPAPHRMQGKALNLIWFWGGCGMD